MKHPIIDVLDRTFGPNRLLPDRFDSPQHRQFSIAVSGQEAALHHRWQVVDLRHPERMGPARGLWQFELGTAASRGGVWGVFLHGASRPWLQRACIIADVACEPRAIWEALAENDTLACAVARCLMLTDARPLPAMGDVRGAEDCYHRLWRPGAWTRGTPAERAKLSAKWHDNYVNASHILGQGTGVR